MKCANCGNEIHHYDAFCSFCGEPLITSDTGKTESLQTNMRHNSDDFDTYEEPVRMEGNRFVSDENSLYNGQTVMDSSIGFQRRVIHDEVTRLKSDSDQDKNIKKNDIDDLKEIEDKGNFSMNHRSEHQYDEVAFSKTGASINDGCSNGQDHHLISRKKKFLLCGIIVILAIVIIFLIHHFIMSNHQAESSQTEEWRSVRTDSYDGHKYRILTGANSWTEAKSYCESQGGHLLTINSEEEQIWINDFISYVDFAYIGIGAELKNGSFVWITGEKFDYTNWAPGEPNNESGDEKYGMIYGKNPEGIEAGLWNDMGEESLENYSFAFICEWDENGSDS